MTVLVDFFEDLSVGAKYELGAKTFDTATIKGFAEKYDPQAFHMDEAAAQKSHFGKLCASGWQTISSWMRVYVDLNMAERAARETEGIALPEIGVSPGLRELKWPRPVFVDDTVSYTQEIIEKRPLNSRPGWGLVTTHGEGRNQRGEVVVSFISSTMVQMRAD
ncbi:MAG: MaoC family dehydratase [Hyphomicrobiales bacterium]